MIPIVDTHQHLVYRERWPYDWATGYLPRDGEGFRLADYQQAARDTGIMRTVFMETGLEAPHYEAERRFMKTLAEDPSTIVSGVIANARPEASQSEFQAWLDAANVEDYLKGARRILHVMPDDLSRSTQFRENVGRLGDAKVVFDMCFLARQLPVAMELADACPMTRFVLDHCGVPDIAGVGLDPWRASIRELAKRPHVICKISGLPAYCQPGTVSVETLRPYVEHCIESFGWDRVVWGGDWPVCCTTSSLRDWVNICREITADASEEDKHKLFHKNAERIYRLSPS